MIGWKPKPFIFIHIPKCAGTSLEKAFIPLVSHHQDFAEFSQEELTRFWLPSNQGLQHSKLSDYEKSYALDKYFKFAIVRNPWDRAVSQIKYLRSKIGETLFPGNDFKKHVEIYCNTSRQPWKHDLGACQLDYLQERSGKITMNYIGRFECLHQDFKTVCEMMELSHIPALPHVFNSMRTRHYRTYFDEESSGWIEKRFARDIEYFGYQFEEIPSPDSLAQRISVS